MSFVADVDSDWQHCGRPAEWVECEKCEAIAEPDQEVNCWYVTCTKCGEVLAPSDCEEALDKSAGSSLE